MNPNKEQRTGLVAGAGEVPIYFARKAFENGIKIVSVAFNDEIDARLAPFVEKNYSIGIGKIDTIFKTMKKENVTDLMILGKVDKSVIFKPQLFDLRTLKFLNRIRNHEDKTLMLGVIEELEKEGFRLLDQRQFMREIFPGKGVLTQRKPTQKEMEDIQFGMPLAKQLADMEIGQTLIVKNKTIVAIEAVEGTDRAIERGCALSKGKGVVIKVSRTDQDYRYDSPGIGPKTMETVIRGGASVLALEAERVLIVEQARTVRMADDARVSILCV